MISNNEIALRLVLAAVSGGLIGTERQVNNRHAGLRTHILVAVGSALIMLVSKYGFEGVGDPARLAAQVVSGIGFLGAGTIIREGTVVKGLTTGAGVWVCGGIGLAIGNGYYFAAILSTIIVLFSLISLGFMEEQIIRRRSLTKRITLQCKKDDNVIESILNIVQSFNIRLQNITITPYNTVIDDTIVNVEIKSKIPRNINYELFMARIFMLEGVVRIVEEVDLDLDKDIKESESMLSLQESIVP